MSSMREQQCLNLFTAMSPRLKRVSGNSRCLINICAMNEWMNAAQLALCSRPAMGFHIRVPITKTDWPPLGKDIGLKDTAAAFHSSCSNPVQRGRGARAVPSPTYPSRDTVNAKGLPNTFPQAYHWRVCWFKVLKRYSRGCYQCVNSSKT